MYNRLSGNKSSIAIIVLRFQCSDVELLKGIFNLTQSCREFR
jgi:hypothetical protein